jgi:hypothetical protein
MSKLAHSSTDEMMDAIERQGRFLEEQEAKQAAYVARRKAWRESLEFHDVRKESES